MKAILKDILESQSELEQLYALPLRVKARYWVGRIRNQAKSITAEFMELHDKIIIDHGEMFVLDTVPATEAIPATDTSPEIPYVPEHQEWMLVGTGEDVTGKQTQFRVKQDRLPDFNYAIDEVVLEEVDIPFDKIKLDDLGDVEIRFDITKLMWFLE